MQNKLSIDTMSLAAKAGQVMMCGFAGQEPVAALSLIHDLGVGAIIYFSRNLGPPKDVAILSAQLQSAAAASPTGWPLLIATDQEGGPVSRLSSGVPRWPSAMALAAASLGLGDPDLVRRVYFALGRQLVACGINTNFAPVLDVNDNPRNPVIGVRSFGDDPRRVAVFGTMAARGLAEAGLLAVGKHFPGHGNAFEDSHAVLPVVRRSSALLDEIELTPFRHAIAKGIGALMTAHVVYPALDPVHPATLSGSIIRHLRQGLGFNGLLFTDCLEMSAIAKGVGTAEGAVQALKAGADMLLVSHSTDVQHATHRAIVAAAQSGELPMQRLDEALTRIAAIKRKLSTLAPTPPTAAEGDEHDALRRAVFEASVTVLGDKASLLPLPKDAVVHAFCAREDGVQSKARAALKELLCSGDGIDVQERSLVELEQSAHLSVNTRDTALVMVRGVPHADSQTAAVRGIARHYTRLIIVSLSAPYDLAVCGNHAPGLCLYGADPQALRALANVLRGERKATGQSPVRVRWE